jgi:hypothetical protein
VIGNQVEFATPLEDDEDRLDAYYDDELLRYRTMTNIIGDHPPPPPPQCLFAELHLTHAGEPANYVEAKDDPAWRAAMEQELKAVEQNRTWELVPLPAGHQPITLKWVFKLKKDELGAVTKHKARLVARGFVQQEGVDYDDAFAPVARPPHGCQIRFPQRRLQGGGIRAAAARLHRAGEEGKVYRLRKALYGLRQAPRAWKLDAMLKYMGFQ